VARKCQHYYAVLRKDWPLSAPRVNTAGRVCLPPLTARARHALRSARSREDAPLGLQVRLDCIPAVRADCGDIAEIAARVAATAGPDE